MRWTSGEVRKALGIGGGGDTTFTGIATDTRTLAPGAVFVALTGERFDGHDHLAAARDAGAAAAVVRVGTAPVSGLPLFEVPDPLRGLGDLARHRRCRIAGPVIAVTGTNGKTSTKEMVAGLLRTRYVTHATRANLNNLIGVPLTILDAPAETEALVVEAGASLPGEIGRYREIIEPMIAVITMVGFGHLEGFGSPEAVLWEKLSLTDGVSLAVVGTEPPALADGARGLARRVLTAGLEGADVIPDRVRIEPDGRPRIEIDGVSFVLGIPGLHQARNAMCAWAVSRELGLDPSASGAALERLAIPGGRGQIRQHGALTILDDSYNANPESFRAAIRLAAAMREAGGGSGEGQGGRRLVFVAGTMRELGPRSAALHRQVTDELRTLGADLLVGIGEFAEAFGTPRPGELTAPDAVAAGPLVAEQIRGDELVVLKASRGVALERILPVLIDRAASTP